MSQTEKQILINLRRAVQQYECTPEHSQEQELALWGIEAAIEDLQRSNDKRNKEYSNDQSQQLSIYE